MPIYLFKPLDAMQQFKLGKTRQLDMQHRNICVLYGVLPKPGSYCKKLNISHNDIISIPPSLLLKWNRICSLRLNYNNMTFVSCWPFQILCWENWIVCEYCILTCCFTYVLRSASRYVLCLERTESSRGSSQ